MNHDRSEVVQTVAAGNRRALWLCVGVTMIVCAAMPAVAASGKYVLHNTPGFVATSKNLGAANPSEVIEVSLWLNPHNRSQMDELAQQLYDPGSANYRHFLNRSQFTARFAPSAEEAKTVQQFVEAHNLKVVRIGPDNFFVRASGTVAEVEAAFHVQLNRYQVGDTVTRANDRDPYIDGDAASVVRSIGGFDNMQYRHPAMSRPALGQTAGQPAVAAAATQSDTASSFFTNNCFNGTETDVFSTNNDGSFPIGTYTGNHLNLQSLTSAGCGYTPPMIKAAYKLSGLYKSGFDGQGQTIGLIEGCGSLTIQDDANAFSAMFNLPQLTSSNFAITYIPSPSVCATADAVEINIDVEWAHAIAPGANINVLVGTTGSFEDLNEAEFTAVNYGLATVLSGSYGLPEPVLPTSFLETLNFISESAAVTGISANFSSGDTGDFTADGLPPTVSAPADSPWSTAVGGITLALTSNNSIAWQAGWGNNETLLAEEGIIVDPPSEGASGFFGGSGGGPSDCVSQSVNSTTGLVTCLGGFAKPSYQSKLAGKSRQVPDVSWLADPFTGAVIAISVPGSVPELVWQVWGGTSVACPMFSALWAIANQVAGTPLGLAAPYLYSLPAGAVTDIVPVSSKHNVTASIAESTTVVDKYNADAVLGGGAPGSFVSAIWDDASIEDTALVISFDTDCTAGETFGFITPCTSASSLHTKVGWDNVTGVGVPNGQAFVNAFAPPASPVKE
jgi:subtilase family serine protease